MEKRGDIQDGVTPEVDTEVSARKPCCRGKCNPKRFDEDLPKRLADKQAGDVSAEDAECTD